MNGEIILKFYSYSGIDGIGSIEHAPSVFDFFFFGGGGGAGRGGEGRGRLFDA